MPRPEPIPTAFELFLENARKGSKFVYFVGHTVVDRSGLRFPVAQTAYEAFITGKVNLTQRRIPNSDGLFEYIAQKR